MTEPPPRQSDDPDAPEGAAPDVPDAAALWPDDQPAPQDRAREHDEPSREQQPDAFADLADGVQRHVDPRHVTVLRIAGWIRAGVLGGGGLVALLIVWMSGVPAAVTTALLGVWVLFAALLVWTAHPWPAIAHRYKTYSVTPAGLEIRRGVIWRSITTLPRSRVQHTDVTQGPLERRYGVATIVAHTAGTQFAVVSLDGLAHERAERLRDFLIQEAGSTERADGV